MKSALLDGDSKNYDMERGFSRFVCPDLFSVLHACENRREHFQKYI